MSTTSEAAIGEGLARPSSLSRPIPAFARLLFLAALLGCLAYVAVSIFIDTQGVGEQLALGVFAFLGLALVIALGFEFVNGFHDTANAVATVIYTNAMPAQAAVVWSGIWNLIGVLVSTGAVAYSIITLLPVDLILNVGSGAGFAMILALLLAAVLWNVATWYVGLPNSSSHTLIGSIMGVGLANQLVSAGSKGGTAGVDWAQAQKVLSALLFSPAVGFVGALLLMLAMRYFFRNRSLYETPPRDAPPPRGIRALLIFTCTAVSFAHGGNDGQKGMGLIMLILIGCAPTAYAINRTMPASETPAFVAAAHEAAQAFRGEAGTPVPAGLPEARETLRHALQARSARDPALGGALALLSDDLARSVEGYGSLKAVPAAATRNLRNDMYLVLDASNLLVKAPDAAQRFGTAQGEAIKAYQKRLEDGTRYIPTWVKIAVALALGLGTMVGWKRIVITVGEKIGKAHFSYGMGASAELVAAGTILLAEKYGLPVSTTHILTSGVAGAAVGQGSGLQGKTIFNMVLAWVLTLPVAMALSGALYWLFLQLIGSGGI